MYQTSKYYSYIFYTSRNVRPCTILGYTLTTFPKSHKTLLHNQSNRNLWHNCKSNTKQRRKQQKQTSTELRAEGPCIIGGESGQQVFYTERKQLNKLRKKEILNLQNNRKKDNTKFCILFFIYI